MAADGRRGGARYAKPFARKSAPPVAHNGVTGFSAGRPPLCAFPLVFHCSAFSVGILSLSRDMLRFANLTRICEPRLRIYPSSVVASFPFL